MKNGFARRGCVIIAVVTGSITACGSAAPSVAPATSPSLDSTTASTNPGTESTSTESTKLAERFPDVIDVVATADGPDTWTFAVTLSSPYDSPDRYADSWRVRDGDGTVYGERFLTHDHASEQPFTRSQSGIQIPQSVTSVIVEGRDQHSGWGGTTMTIELDSK